MNPPPARDPLGLALLASLLAGILTGAADTLLVLATNPDTGLATYRLAYTVGPVAIPLAWAPFVGAVAAACWRGRGKATAAASAVAALWALGVVGEAVRADQSGRALAVLATLLAIAALALVRLAVETATVVARLGRTARGLLATTAVAFALVALAALGAAWRTTFAGGTGPCAAGAPPDAPNVLLVSVDALRADAAREMRSYRRLAARGIEFTQHTTGSPWTLPSVASLLTGLATDQHGAGRSRSWRSLVDKTPLAPDVSTLAGRLGARGYRTHAIVTNPFLTARYGIDTGFCSFANVSMAGETARAFGETTPLRLVRALAPGLLPSDRARVVRARAERWLAREHDAPFFLWLHFLYPHAPYGDRDGAPTSLTLDLMAFQHRDEPVAPFRAIGLLRAGEYRPGPAARARIAALYREDVAAVDGELGRLLDTLEARGLADRTAVVLTADHGEEFWEHGGVEHGRTLYEEVLRVPLVVVPAGGGVASVRSEPTSVIDLVPTILALAGMDAPASPGVPLLAAIPPRDRVLPLGNLLFGEEWGGMRRAGLKYVRSEHGEERLFDLDVDPEERVNRVAAMPAALAEARRMEEP